MSSIIQEKVKSLRHNGLFWTRNTFFSHQIAFHIGKHMSSYAIECAIVASDDPPRPEEDSTLQKVMAGYMAARADFSVEHKQHFEDLIMNLEESDGDDELDKGEICLWLWCLSLIEKLSVLSFLIGRLVYTANCVDQDQPLWRGTICVKLPVDCVVVWC